MLCLLPTPNPVNSTNGLTVMTNLSSQNFPSLYISNGVHAGEQEHWSITNSTTIGREQADITIALPGISRKHAEVTVCQSAYRIKDLNSKNGTAVNGKLLTDQPHRLLHDDTIVLAGSIELRFTDPNATPCTPRLGKLSGLWIDSKQQEVWIDAQKLSPPLSAKQIELLRLIAEAEGRILSKDEIISQLWSEHNAKTISNDAVDSLLKRLRRRLAGIERNRSIIEVLRGRGVRLRLED